VSIGVLDLWWSLKPLMGSSSHLVDRLDFNIGLSFQEDIQQHLHAPVHHPFPSPDGSFLLLAMFRRFLFSLTEESVSLALQSCLGGRASDFHVRFLSNNHFCFSVFPKKLGFRSISCAEWLRLNLISISPLEQWNPSLVKRETQMGFGARKRID
jgi:hypothetical protein